MKRPIYSVISLTIMVVMCVYSVPAVTFSESTVQSKTLENLQSADYKKTTNFIQNSIEASEIETTISSAIIDVPLDESINEKLPSAYVDGEVIVKYKEANIDLSSKEGRTKALNFADVESLEQVGRLPEDNISVLKILSDVTVEQKIDQLERNANIEYAQPNFQYTETAIATNDTHKEKLWSFDNTGQTVNTISGIPDADVDMPEAWAVNEGTNATNSIIVAVIDSGVAYNHPDLLSNMWDGTSCVSDTNAPLGNCNHGYDFGDNDKIPLPTYSSHGTHIAGIIASVKNNSKGIIGVAPNAKIMALKSSLTTSDNLKAINFAKYNGAKVINASWAGSSFDQALKDAIDSFPGIFVTASGNDFLNNEITHKYPSDYDSANIISVTATDQNDALATFSNYGVTSVDVGAPGTNIYSAIANTTLLNQTFEGVVPPAVPSGWIVSGTSTNVWGTYNIGGAWGKVLYSDLTIPYANIASSSIMSPTYDVSGSSASLDFWTRCDTEYSDSEWRDYMVLEVSGDGSNFTQIERWDEASLDMLNEESPATSTNSATYHFSGIAIPSSYRTANFKFRFRWVTNASDNNYDGCLVDDVKILMFTNGADEKYGFMDGTSLATPHVTGLVALIEGYNPTLTTTEVKNIILTSGDSLGSLSGKTVSGKRINAEKALQASTPQKAITAFNFLSPSVSGIVNEGAKTIILTVPFGTSLTALIPTITVSPGASVSPASVIAHDFTASSTYTVTALDGATQAYDVAIVVAPNSAKAISSFSFPEGTGIISGTNISVTVPYGTSVTTLTPTVGITGASVSPLSGIPQNFSSPVTYTVTASDNSTQAFVVTVNVLSGGGGGGSGGGGGTSSSKPKKPVVPSIPPVIIAPSPLTPTSSTSTAVPANTSVTPAVSNYKFLVDLTIGAQGVDVTELQKRLTKEGVYTGTISGYLGPLTARGVRAYQSKVGIMVTGYVGPQTREKLNAEQTVSSTPVQNATITALIASLKTQLLILIQQLVELQKKEMR